MSVVEKFKPGHCEDCVHEDCMHEHATEPLFKASCKGCLGTWGTELEKLNFEPKPEFVLEHGWYVPVCRECKHFVRIDKHLECKYCTGISRTPTGNYFEPKTRLSSCIVEPVTVEEEVMPIARGNVRIENAMQLMRAGGLTGGDTVVFGDAVYCVNDTYLLHSEYYNAKIFTTLGIGVEEKHELASMAYGYVANIGDWPEYETADYSAATRLVYTVYALCDAKRAEDYADKVLHINELKVQLESYQQDEDDAAIDLAEAQRNCEYEKGAREQLEADIELLEKTLSK